MVAAEVNCEEDEINKIIAEVDHHGNGKINYTEFLSATVEVKRFMTEEKLWMMFKHFDVDDTGFISKDNINKAMSKMGKEVSEEEVEAMMATHDLKKDGQLSFEEFKYMFLHEPDQEDECENEKSEDEGGLQAMVEAGEKGEEG